MPAKCVPSQSPAPVRILRGRSADQRGRLAEAAVEAALIGAGWSILARRVRTGAGEIDLVAANETVLAIVEVKARARLSDAASAILPRQQARLLEAAEALLAAHPDWMSGRALRFDAILVDASGTVRRITDAFRQE